MKTVLVLVKLAMDGISAEHPFEIEFEDDASEEYIEEIVHEKVLERVSWSHQLVAGKA